ncbi:MAG: Fic family protein, partial [Nitrospinae bacterium]|nr:Fic family protein [Nitrospinota bacterium]
MAEAERVAGRLEGQLAGLMRPHKPFRSIFLFQGAFSAFTLENTKISIDDHFLSIMSENDGGNGSSDPISLYCKAYDAGLEYLDKNLPPSLDLILQIYRQIFQSDTVSKGVQEGFREKTGDPVNLFGLSGEEFQYVPPPESLMKTALYSFDKRFRQEIKLPTLVDISLIFYQFMAIQPLSGGNMATACLLSDLLLATSLETKSIPVSVAPFISKNKGDCANRFFHLIKTGDWGDWISFFLRGMAWEFAKARQTVSAVTALREDYRKRLE